MTRSIFDPGGQETERSGSTHLGQRADNISHMPPGVTDGEVSEEEVADAVAAAAAEDQNLSTEERLEMLNSGEAAKVAEEGVAPELTGGEQNQSVA